MSNASNQIISDDLIYRITGVMLLLIIVPYAYATFLYDGLKVEDMSETLTNMAAAGILLKQAWAAKFVSKIATLVFATSLFLLLRRADPRLAGLALMALVLRSVETAMAGTAEMSSVFMAQIASDYMQASASAKAHYYALASFVLTYESFGLIVASFFFCLGNAMFFALFFIAKVPALPRWVCVFCFVASIIVLFGLPFQAFGIIDQVTMDILWAPTFYEIPLGLWLLFRGANTPKTKI